MMKAIALVSTGIDSPVACWMMRRQGFEMIYLHLKTKHDKKGDDKGGNMQGENKGTIKELIDKIDPGARLIIKDYVSYLQEVKGMAKERYGCILCKRGMLKEAEKLAYLEGAEAIITGENLAQVASQTLANLAVIDASVKMPVLRPLLGFDKNEIIKIARDIGTYKLSISDNGICPFVPAAPATRSKLKAVEIEERKIYDKSCIV